MAWEGWNDACDAASTAAQFLIQQMGGEPFAAIDPEEFYDFTEARPMARYRDGERVIDWPQTEFVHLRHDGRDVIVGLGLEPHYHWKRYLRAMSELVDAAGVKLVISLGAVGAGTPHTQPVPVSGSANNDLLAERYDMRPSRFEGPSGIVGVFHDHCRRRDVGGVSLWASVPHYLNGMTNPVAAQSLLRVVGDMTGMSIAYAPLERAIAQFEARLQEALRENDELREYVARLEAAMPSPSAPQQPGGGDAELPSADVLIADLEDFLRERQDSGD